jgi:hypothetical protein
MKEKQLMNNGKIKNRLVEEVDNKKVLTPFCIINAME